jgi:hypothetical protein
MAPGGVARPGPTPHVLVWGPGGPLCDSAYCFSGKNIDAIKSLAQFEFQKVPEMSKYTKHVFPILTSE